MRILRTNRAICLGICALLFSLSLSQAQLIIPGNDGTDGTFFPLETNTVVDLSQAVPGRWNDASPQPGKGLYDREKWVIVFKYRNIVIPQGFKVTFKNHPSHAPVVWLSQNNVNLDGVVDVSGSLEIIDGLREPGPGGFRGGTQARSGSAQGAGLGPGGSLDLDGKFAYGNARNLPLLGGSGGSGWKNDNVLDIGGAGGGAILIAAPRVITINGAILANGSSINTSEAYGGSGGAIRLIASQVNGSGNVRALGSSGRANADAGRIRIETSSISSTLNLLPPTIAVAIADPILIVQPDNSPSVRLVAVAGATAPVDPRATLGNAPTDLILTNSAPVPVILETKNMSINSTVNVTFKPKHPVAANIQSAVMTYPATVVSVDGSTITWGVTTTLPIGHFVVQARAITP